MVVAITFGNVLVVDSRVMTVQTAYFADVIRDNDTLIRTTLRNLHASQSLVASKTPAQPSLWVMYLGPRTDVIRFASPDSDIFRDKYTIAAEFHEFWKIIEAANFTPEVRCAKLNENEGAFLLLREFI